MGFVAGVVGGDANGSPVSMDGVGDCTGDATRSGRRIEESDGLCNDSGELVRMEFDSPLVVASSCVDNNPTTGVAR